jgi:hypothetical protein
MPFACSSQLGQQGTFAKPKWLREAILRTKLLDRQRSYLLRIASAVQPDLDDLVGHDIANRIVAINQVQPVEGEVERLL